jgi:hypothetical protein
MALVVMRNEPEVAAAFTGDAKSLREALDRLAPTDCAGDMKAAEEFAARLLASRAGERRTVIRDGAEEAPPDNAAITRFAARTVPASPQTSDVLLEVRNFGAQPLKANVELRLDGLLLDVKPLELAPGGRFSQSFPVVPQPTLNARGWLTAHLDARDALATDNDAFAVLPRLEPMRVLLVTPGNFFLEKALAANPLFRFELLAPDAFRPDAASGFDAVILDGTLPAGFALESTPGNFLFISRTPFDEAGAAAVEHPLVSETDERSPLLRMVNLDAVTFLRAAPLRMPGPRAGWRFAAPVQAFDRPLIVTGSSGAGRAVAFAFDVAESDLPLRVAFPLLVANTLQWLAGEKFDAPPQLAAGEIIDLGEKRAAFPEALRDFRAPVPDAPGKFSAHTLRPLRNGFYATRGASGAGWLAVNTFSVEESDLRLEGRAPSRPTLGNGGAEEGEARRRDDTEIVPPRAQPKSSFDGQAGTHGWTGAEFFNWPPWMFCALAALALFAWEWWLFHRRRTE